MPHAHGALPSVPAARPKTVRPLLVFLTATTTLPVITHAKRPTVPCHPPHLPPPPQNFYPVPRFPIAHTSAAFEAMAVRKSLILTPPEIYAECAHHGAGTVTRAPRGPLRC